jgi:hypothetical protein
MHECMEMSSFMKRTGLNEASRGEQNQERGGEHVDWSFGVIL